MKLKCLINGQTFDIVQGATFSEEYNETLDSGSIMIDQVEKFEIKPYDDVYIWNADENFNGYYNNDKYLVYSECVAGDGSHLRAILYIPIPFSEMQSISLFTTIRINFLNSQGETYNSITKTNNGVQIGDYEFIYDTTNDYYYCDISTANKIFDNIEDFYVKFTRTSSSTLPTFYRHLLVNSYSYERITPNATTLLYKYKIMLFSETKGLETVALPNVSVTEPLKITKKISIWSYINQFVEMYSPKIKRVVNSRNQRWEYVNKYFVDPGLETIFGNSYSPDFTLNNPSLKDILHQLMITKDRIPVVRDNMITCLDITQRTGDFNTNGVFYISHSRSAADYCDNLKRTYSDALSQDYSTRMIEYLGFRNSDAGLMTLSNMRLETRFPIYKINKLYVCYYKKVNITYYTDPENPTGTINNQDFIFLCKQDMTPLTVLSSLRAILDVSWEGLSSSNIFTKTIQELAQYKYCTIGYDIGSKNISGWGEKTSYPVPSDDLKTVFTQEMSVIELILPLLDKNNKLGIYNFGYVVDLFKNSDPTRKNYTVTSIVDAANNDYTDAKIAVGRFWKEIQKTPKSFYTENNKNWLNQTITLLNNIVMAGYVINLKTLFFEMDYDGFYNGTIIQTKDNAQSDITINDNSSSSLTLLEKDGISQKEKVNRYGNESFTAQARYNNDNGSISASEVNNKLQILGSVYDDGSTDINEDWIIYHRNYSIYDNVIQANYYGMKNYVLKNYFTSVYAKHRPYNLMSYGESVNRAENRKLSILLSKDKLYYEKNEKIEFNNFNTHIYEKIFSCFKASPTTKGYYIDYVDKINYGYLTYTSNNSIKKYLTDINCAVSGNSMCFNIKMFDNISTGTKITQMTPKFNFGGENIFNDNQSLLNYLFGGTGAKNRFYEKDYTGSTQKLLKIVDDETGFKKELGFYVAHKSVSNILGSEIIEIDEGETTSDRKLGENYQKLMDIPTFSSDTGLTNKIGKVYEINADNKETIDMTFQIEPYTDEKDVFISSWFMKLSDLVSTYNKVNKRYDASNDNATPNTINCVVYTSLGRNYSSGTFGNSDKEMFVSKNNVAEPSLLEAASMLAYNLFNGFKPNESYNFKEVFDEDTRLLKNFAIVDNTLIVILRFETARLNEITTSMFLDCSFDVKSQSDENAAFIFNIYKIVEVHKDENNNIDYIVMGCGKYIDGGKKEYYDVAFKKTNFYNETTSNTYSYFANVEFTPSKVGVDSTNTKPFLGYRAPLFKFSHYTKSQNNWFSSLGKDNEKCFHLIKEIDTTSSLNIELTLNYNSSSSVESEKYSADYLRFYWFDGNSLKTLKTQSELMSVLETIGCNAPTFYLFDSNLAVKTTSQYLTYANGMPLANTFDYLLKGNSESKDIKQNCFVTYTTSEIKKQNIFDEYKGVFNNDGTFTISNNDYKLAVNSNGKYIAVEEVFKVSDNKIIIDISKITTNDVIKSVQYWYCETGNHELGSMWEETISGVTQLFGTCHFVFGVNTTTNTTIYLSNLTSYNQKVFGANNMYVADNLNYASSNNYKTYGEEQYYTDDNINVTNNGFIYRVVNNEVHIVNYKGLSNAPMMPNIIDNKPVVAIDDYAFKNKTSITAFEIVNEGNNPSHLLTIGSGAFQGCTNLATFTYAPVVEGVGSYVTEIKPNTFKDCVNLSTINNFDSITTINFRAFENTQSLDRFTVNSAYSWAFYNSGVQYFTYNGIMPSNLLTGCSSLKRIDANDFTNGQLSLVLGATRPSGLTRINLYNCSNQYAYTFENYTSIENILLNGTFSAIPATCFKGCTSLKKVLLTQNIKSESATDYTHIISSFGANSFYGCTSMKSVYFPIGNSILVGTDAFYGCTSLTKVYTNLNVSYNDFKNYVTGDVTWDDENQKIIISGVSCSIVYNTTVMEFMEVE